MVGLGGEDDAVALSMLIMDRNYDQRSVYTEADGKMLENAAVDKDPGNELNDGNFFQRVRAYWQDEAGRSSKRQRRGYGDLGMRE